MRAKEIHINPGAKVFLRLLEESEIPRGTATSIGTEKAIHHLKKVALFYLLNGVIDGDQLSIGKPNPKIYFRAAHFAGTEAP